MMSSVEAGSMAGAGAGEQAQLAQAGVFAG